MSSMSSGGGDIFWPQGITAGDIIPIVPADTPSYPPTQAELDALAAINDPAFTAAWLQCKYGLVFKWQGDPGVIQSLYPLCQAYFQNLQPVQPIK